MSAEVSSPNVASARYFYVGVFAFVVVFTFGAFTSSYWTSIADGSRAFHAAIHAHAALFFIWTLFFLSQAILVAQGRTLAHREWGMLGVALAGAMVFSGAVALIVQLAQLMGTPRERFVIGTTMLGVTTLSMFAIFVTAALANIRRPEWHKRFMVLATFIILQAAIARPLALIPDLTQPQRALVIMTIGNLMILTVILLDARIKGRVHPAYIAGGALILLLHLVRSPLTHTPWWRDACQWLASLAG